MKIQYHLSKFVKHFRFNTSDTIKLNMVKYIIGNASKALNSMKKFNKQEDLLKALFKEEYYILIILDACRYDMFKIIFHKYIRGKLIGALSPGSNTYEWLPRVFPILKFKYPKVFSAHPAINSIGVEYRGFKAIKYIPSENIIDIWKYRWNKTFNTVLPMDLVRYVTKYGLSNKNILWFVQPHFPWIYNYKVSEKIIKESIKRKIDYEVIIKEMIKRRRLSREQIIRAYMLNLHEALNAVSKLIDFIKRNGFYGRIIITSDHGELLGEYGLYGHVQKLYLSELRIVPWLEVNYNT